MATVVLGSVPPNTHLRQAAVCGFALDVGKQGVRSRQILRNALPALRSSNQTFGDDLIATSR